jgi:DNA mismatch repair protein MutH
MPNRPSPPQNEAELWSRARDLVGMTLAELAADDGCAAPDKLLHAKGWTGQLLERRLGATAGSKDEPDFQSLGIELKTIPVDQSGRPCESTFVCTIPLLDVAVTEWERSRVHRKLQRVLWMVVQGSRDIPVAERRIGSPLLWSPDAEENALLKQDWDELAGLIGRGEIESITGHLGQVMQVRPKARNAQARRVGFDEQGVAVSQMPRGFYLRASFTGSILKRAFVMPQRH